MQLVWEEMEARAIVETVNPASYSRLALEAR